MRTERLNNPPRPASVQWQAIAEIVRRCSEPHQDGPPTLSTLVSEVAESLGVERFVVEGEIQRLEDEDLIRVNRHTRLDPEVVWV
jgi:DNA-binding MarR family transcriptional regulator